MDVELDHPVAIAISKLCEVLVVYKSDVDRNGFDEMDVRRLLRRRTANVEEEQHIAVAICHGYEELVYDGEIFWGAVYSPSPLQPLGIQELTTRNNLLIERVLESCLGFLPAPLRLLVAHMVHFHGRLAMHVQVPRHLK